MPLSGTTMKSAFGVLDGGRMTPGGTSRIVTLCVLALEKSVPVADATIETQLPGSGVVSPFDAHVPILVPVGGAAGAVKIAVATPFDPVMIDFADSLPKSAGTPFCTVCNWIGTFDSG